MGSAAKSLLLEIGTEELPSSFVDAALAALPGLVKTKLDALRLSHGEIRALGTPRRLAVHITGVATEQPDLDEEVIGPPETAAFKDGKPTKAAEAFATKLGVSLESLKVEDRPAAGKTKAGRYVIGRRQEKGKDARELLGKALGEVCAEIPFRKSMRWGAGDATFGRPVQWLVALSGSDAIDVSFAGVRSGKTSLGHRFLTDGKPVPIESADAYVDTMRKAHVVVDRQEREKTMMERVAEAAKAAGGEHDPDVSLIADNASLVEEPFVVTGGFEKEYLSLPATVIRSVARGHQKYFCVAKPGSDAQELLPHYLTVVNTALAPEKIAKGNDRVMRARLSDAKFFYEEDKKAKIEDRVEKLGGIVFHNRLGTVREKITRLEELSAHIAAQVSADQAIARRAAHLCKFDLVSLMVGEFPELQGDMGRSYALHAGEKPEVANAVRDHYRPIGAEGPIAEDDISACVAIADRLDSLVGCFAVGLSPTGAADPFALRRACIAILRTLLESPARNAAYAKLSLPQLFAWAYEGLAATGKKLDLSKEDTLKKVGEFTAERLRGLIATQTSNAVADAVCAGGELDHPAYAMERARELQAAVDAGSEWIGQAKTVAKRLAGISKESKPILHGKEAFEKAEDHTIHEVVFLIDSLTKKLETRQDVANALAGAKNLAVRLEAIFTSTLVNDPNDERTPKRLELLSHGAQSMLRIGDFSRLA